MRKIINSTYVTLDGVVEAPHLWPSPGHADDGRAGSGKADNLLSVPGVATAFDLVDVTTLSDGVVVLRYADPVTPS